MFFLQHSNLDSKLCSKADSSIDCHECANYPGYPGAACDSPNLPVIKCGSGMDRCMTLKGTMDVSGYNAQITMRNCSSSLVCEGRLPNFKREFLDQKFDFS